MPEKRPSAADVLERIEKMGVKSRFIELRESRQREERERREQKVCSFGVVPCIAVCARACLVYDA